jgi:hypothetical protein
MRRTLLTRLAASAAAIAAGAVLAPTAAQAFDPRVCSAGDSGATGHGGCWADPQGQWRLVTGCLHRASDPRTPTPVAFYLDSPVTSGVGSQSLNCGDGFTAVSSRIEFV